MTSRVLEMTQHMDIQFVATDTLPRDVEAMGHMAFAGGTGLSPEVLGSSPEVEVDADFCRRRGFGAAPGQAIIVPGTDAYFRVIVGLGDKLQCSADGVRSAAAWFAREIPGCTHVSFDLRGAAGCGLSVSASAQAVAEGISLASHRFAGYRTSRKPRVLERVTVVADADDVTAASAGLSRGAVVARAVNLARDLANEPAGVLTPSRFADIASELAASSGLHVQVLGEDEIRAEHLGGLLGVARGSSEPPRLVKLVYDPGLGSPAGGRAPAVALVGKGITFDSGGLSLKSAEGMMAMKTDMSGAAVVIATLSACRDLGVPVRVTGIVPITENMPGGHATKPGDVLTIRNGKTVEVLNTDAEGRLVLADGLSLAAEDAPDAIIDVATLTKDCIVALGREFTGVMTNDDDLAGQVIAASRRAGEGFWQLPLPPQYKTHIASEIADIKNTGVPGEAGALTAGLFLSEFVGDTPWVHLDICGHTQLERDYMHKGASGFGVRTLAELLMHFRPRQP